MNDVTDVAYVSKFPPEVFRVFDREITCDTDMSILQTSGFLNNSSSQVYLFYIMRNNWVAPEVFNPLDWPNCIKVGKTNKGTVREAKGPGKPRKVYSGCRHNIKTRYAGLKGEVCVGYLPLLKFDEHLRFVAADCPEGVKELSTKQAKEDWCLTWERHLITRWSENFGQIPEMCKAERVRDLRKQGIGHSGFPDTLEDLFV